MDGRLQKQLIVGLIFLIIVGGISYFSFRGFINSPTCFDNIKNGREEGVDCGTLACGKACEPAIMPIEIKFSELIKTMAGDYDFISQVYNPNIQYGSGNIQYQLSIYDSNSPQFEEKSHEVGTFYILPGQTKYVISTALKIQSKLTPDDILKAKFSVTSVDWQNVDLNSEPVQFLTIRQAYADNKNSSYLEGVVSNRSNFDFDKVDIGVVLFDGTGNILDINKTDIRTFINNTDRSFKVDWPFAVNGQVIKEEIQIDTNLFENSNYIKTHGTQQKFQKYY